MAMNQNVCRSLHPTPIATVTKSFVYLLCAGSFFFFLLDFLFGYRTGCIITICVLLRANDVGFQVAQKSKKTFRTNVSRVVVVIQVSGIYDRFVRANTKRAVKHGHPDIFIVNRAGSNSTLNTRKIFRIGP